MSPTLFNHGRLIQSDSISHYGGRAITGKERGRAYFLPCYLARVDTRAHVAGNSDKNDFVSVPARNEVA